MDYTYQVAYLNTLKVKKLIPPQLLQEVETNKNLSSLISLLKEYNYSKLKELTNIDLSSAENFEEVIYSELLDTTKLISKLLHRDHQWLIDWMEYFYEPKEFSSTEDIINFQQGFWLNFQKLNSNFCLQLLRLIIDFENIKLFLSYVATDKKNSLIFIQNGNIQTSKFKEYYPHVELLNNYITSNFYPLIKINLQDDINVYFYYYLSHLLWFSKFFYFTIEPIVAYFFEKLTEIHRIKKIYYDIKITTS